MVSLILINFDEVAVCARMGRRNVIDERFIDGFCLVDTSQLRVGLRHQNQRIHILRLSVHRNLQGAERARIVRLIDQFLAEGHIGIRSGNFPTPLCHELLTVFCLKEHVPACRYHEERQQQNDNQHMYHSLM